MAKCGKLTKKNTKCKNQPRKYKYCHFHRKRGRRGRTRGRKKKTYSAGYVTRLKNQLSQCKSPQVQQIAQDCSAIAAELAQKKEFIATESKRSQRRILDLTKALKETKRAHDYLVNQVTMLGKDMDTLVHQRNRFEARAVDAEILAGKDKKQLSDKINELDQELASRQREIKELKLANTALTTAKVAIGKELKKFQDAKPLFKRILGKLKGGVGNHVSDKTIKLWEEKADKIDKILTGIQEPSIAAARRCKRKRKRKKRKAK